MTKKGIALALIPMIALVASCAHRPHKRSANPVEINGELMMVGPISYKDILEYFPAWKTVNQRAQPTEDIISGIKEISMPLDIECFVGTWCSDSRHEVPPFMKALGLAGNPHIHIELIGVDRQKDDPGHLGPMNNIELVPTFIVRSNGVELFRMVEFPKTSFAEDLLTDLKTIR